MSHHVFHYYMNKAKIVNTGDAMKDYCIKDVYISLAVRDLK